MDNEFKEKIRKMLDEIDPDNIADAMRKFAEFLTIGINAFNVVAKLTVHTKVDDALGLSLILLNKAIQPLIATTANYVEKLDDAE